MINHRRYPIVGTFIGIIIIIIVVIITKSVITTKNQGKPLKVNQTLVGETQNWSVVLKINRYYNNTSASWHIDKLLTLKYKGFNPSSVKGIEYSFNIPGVGGGGGEESSLDSSRIVTGKSSAIVSGNDQYWGTIFNDNATVTITVKWNGFTDKFNLSSEYK